MSPRTTGGLGKSSRDITLLVSDSIVKLFGLFLWAVNVLVLVIITFLRMIGRTVEMVMVYIPRSVSKVMPKKTGNSLDNQLVFAGVDMSSEEVLSYTLVYSVVITISVFIASSFMGLSATAIYAVVIISFVIVWAAPWIIITVLINKRVDSVEKMLPDILSIVSQNMASGMTSYNALWGAARPEFGPAAEELQKAAKDTLMGSPLTDALYAMTHRVRSDRLSRSIRLIIQGINSGGDLPEVLERISEDMRDEFNLRDEMASETNAQAMFIMFASMVGGPMLLAVSHQFISIFSGLMTKLDVGRLADTSVSSGMFQLSELSIGPGFFQLYSLSVIATTGLFAALLTGLLRRGSPVNGIPSIPLFVIVSVAVFFGIKYVLGLMFGGMIAF